MQGADRASPEPLEGNAKYEKVRDINRGSYGFVQLARDRSDGTQIAIKFLPRGEGINVYVEREILNHSVLLHPHIIQFREVFLTPDYLAIAMEFAPGGDMFQYVKRKKGLQEHEARWFFQQLIVGLDYCHKMGVVNRDIKLENTLLDQSRRPLIKICDFGYSKHLQKDSVPKSRVGTPGYTAPEIISNLHIEDAAKIDIWSAGVMLYVMLFCCYPFERPDDNNNQGDQQKYQRLLQRIMRADYWFPSHRPASREVKELLGAILVVDPAKRVTIAQIQEHPWFMRDLPPGLTTFNNACLAQQRAQPRQPAMAANREHVRAIVAEAQRPAPGLLAYAGVDDEEDDDSVAEVDAMMDFGSGPVSGPLA
ncbi:hypothetical protein WJX81_004902 [Elliptochloris bilobata]|uniref:Protein kinase domain-containing protein n=1 Tax=Elliptochloris bilobata TaxID=381761 RepID=A0AAW1S5A7_9CHLO